MDIRTAPHTLRAAATLALALLTAAASPQRQGEVKRLGVEDGLPDGYVSSLAQDRRGHLWVGTDGGLCLFDGSRFRTFDTGSSGMKSNSVNSLLYDDAADRLWVGTKSGLMVMECATRQMWGFDIPELFNIFCLAPAADGGIWIVNDNTTIVHHRPTGGPDSIAVYSPSNLPGLPASLRTVFDDGAGRLLVGHKREGLSIVDLRSLRVETIAPSPSSPGGLPSGDVRAILRDSRGSLWVGTSEGLALFDEPARTFAPLDAPTSLCGPVAALREIDGRLWVAADRGGVSTVGATPGRGFAAETLDGLPVNASDILRDSFGNTWVGSHGGGLFFVSRLKAAFRPLPYPGAAWGLCADADGSLWVGGEAEVAQMAGGGVVRRVGVGRHTSRPDAALQALARFGGELLFAPREDGLLSLNVATGRVRRLMPAGRGETVMSFCSAADTLLLVGVENGGIYKYRGGRGVERDEKLTAALDNQTPNGMALDRQGKLWVGTYGMGVVVFAPGGDVAARLRSEEGFATNAVKQLLLDTRGRMWVAGQDGLAVVRDTRRPGEWRNFGRADGLPETNIRAIVEDAAGDVWLSAGRTLTQWRDADGRFESYGLRDGLPTANFADRAAAPAADSLVVFGGHGEACVVAPSSLAEDGSEPTVRFTEFRTLGGETMLPGADGRLTLPYADNSLRIDFAAPDFAISRLVDYEYMVEGLDGQWIDTGRDNHATLRHLPPGDYTLRARARLRRRRAGDAPAAQVSLTVLPPWWRAWWAWAAYALVAAALVALAAWLVLRRLYARKAQELGRRRRDEERRLNEERLRFYTNVAHEIRTPLTLIIGPLDDLAADDRLPDAEQRKVGAISKNAQRLARLVSDILDFRKVETQNRRLEVARGDVGALAREVALRFKELNTNRDVAMKIDIAESLPRIFFDPDVVETILSNFLSNAFKYTPKGSVTLACRAAGEGDGGYVELSVADTGRGIEPDSLPRIFDRFYRADSGRQSVGTGVGLALVKSLAALHRGQVLVESELGLGSTFRLRLPVGETYPDAARRPEADAAADETGEAPPQAAEGDARPIVLIVEDNADIRDYAASSLAADFLVRTAADGRDGLAAALRDIPDVVVSDIMMPHMDGLELTRRLRGDAQTSHIPIILLTAKDSLHDREAGYEAGADSYLVKPFSARLLRSRILNMMDARRRLAATLRAGGAAEAAPARQPGDEAPPPMRISKLDAAFLDKFKGIVEQNIANADLDMPFMQRSLGMSHSTLYRKIKGLLGISGNELIRKLRLRHGAQMLRDGHNVSEAAYASGFNDVSYFRNCFKEEFGMLPKQWAKKNQLTIDNSDRGVSCGFPGGGVM